MAHISWSTRLANILQSINTPMRAGFAASSGFLFGAILAHLSRLSLEFGNKGILFGSLQLGFIVLLSILFGINAAMLLERYRSSQAAHKPSLGSTSIAAMMSLLFSGCWTCGLTLASYIGLGSFLSYFPFGGIELKVISVLLLLVAIYQLSAPEVCALKPTVTGKTTSQ